MLDELKKLNLIKFVSKKNGKYAVNSNTFQTLAYLCEKLIAQFNIKVSQDELKSYLDEFVKRDKISEKQIQEKIHKMFGGKREVKTPVGNIDLLTDKEIIECKKAVDWKHAFGQIESYAQFYPHHEKALYIFGECPKNINECYKLCRQNNVKVYCEFW